MSRYATTTLDEMNSGEKTLMEIAISGYWNYRTAGFAIFMG